MGVRVQISQSFYGQLATILTIVVASVVGFRYAVDEVKTVVKSEMASYVADVEALKKENTELRELLAVNTEQVSATYTSANEFINSFNMKYNKEFITPEKLMLASDKRRRK